MASGSGVRSRRYERDEARANQENRDEKILEVVRVAKVCLSFLQGNLEAAVRQDSPAGNQPEFQVNDAKRRCPAALG